jgi:folate-binding protein YgfZ
MVTNDIVALGPGQGCHAAMLTPRGKMVADLAVYALTEQLLLETDGAQRERAKAFLNEHMIMDDCELRDVTDELPELGLYGDGAAAAVEAALGVAAPKVPYHHASAGAVVVARAPELGVPGFHLFGKIDLAAEPLGDQEFEARRIEAGTPLYGVDMGEDRLPIEAGVTDAVSFTKGCYLGQEVIARATNLGHINKKLVGLVLDGERPAARGAKLSAATRPEAGVVTSSVWSPRLARAIALGYLHRTLWEPGTPLTVHEPDGERGAQVVALPFVRP